MSHDNRTDVSAHSPAAIRSTHFHHHFPQCRLARFGLIHSHAPDLLQTDVLQRGVFGFALPCSR